MRTIADNAHFLVKKNPFLHISAIFCAFFYHFLPKSVPIWLREGGDGRAVKIRRGGGPPLHMYDLKPFYGFSPINFAFFGH